MSIFDFFKNPIEYIKSLFTKKDSSQDSVPPAEGGESGNKGDEAKTAIYTDDPKNLIAKEKLSGKGKMTVEKNGKVYKYEDLRKDDNFINGTIEADDKTFKVENQVYKDGNDFRNINNGEVLKGASLTHYLSNTKDSSQASVPPAEGGESGNQVVEAKNDNGKYTIIKDTKELYKIGNHDTKEYYTYEPKALIVGEEKKLSGEGKMTVKQNGKVYIYKGLWKDDNFINGTIEADDKTFKVENQVYEDGNDFRNINNGEVLKGASLTHHLSEVENIKNTLQKNQEGGRNNQEGERNNQEKEKYKGI